MKTIVFVGFRRFGNYLGNTTAIVANQINRKTILGFQIHCNLLNARILQENCGKGLLETARRLDTVGIVAMGMASEKTGLCIESLAINRIHNSKYVPCLMNNKPVNKYRNYGEKCTLDLDSWNILTFQKRCRAEGVSIMDTSTDAGGFCCNQLMYQVHVDQLRDPKKIPFIFIHVPCCPEAISNMAEFTAAGKVTMETSQVIRGLELLLENSSL